MNTIEERIINVIRKSPGIFAVGIADLVDCEVCEVMPNLQSAIKSGTVIHQRKSQLNSIMGDWFILAGAKATPAVFSSVPKLTASLTDVPPADFVPRNKVQKALEFMKENGGSATNEQLRTVMNLEPNQYPLAYLSYKVGTGIIHRTETGFSLGAMPVGAKTPKPAQVKKLKQQVTEPKPIAADPDPVPESETETETAEETGPEFSCAFWSDGDFSLLRNGEVIAVLAQHELDVVIKFSARFSRI